MATYIVRRCLWVIVLLFTISLITFVIFSVLPAADPAALRAGRQPSPELVESIRVQLGLDKSRPLQFWYYLGDIMPFLGHDGLNFGYSYQSNELVLTQILDRLPATIFLTVGAIVLWLAVAIPVGIISAVKTRSIWDRLSMGFALIFISAPVYFFGLVALYLFADDIGVGRKFIQDLPLLPGFIKDALEWLFIHPGSGAYQDAHGFFEKAHALILPWIVLSLAFAAIYARFLRGNLIDTLQEDYIRTARAKGLSERRVVLKHGVRAAITPIITLLGLDIGILLGGAILTETVFNIQGIGRYAFEAIVRTDLPVIQGTVLFGAFFIVIMNLVVDIAYAFIDPRVRY